MLDFNFCSLKLVRRERQSARKHANYLTLNFIYQLSNKLYYEIDIYCFLSPDTFALATNPIELFCSPQEASTACLSCIQLASTKMKVEVSKTVACFTKTVDDCKRLYNGSLLIQKIPKSR